MSSGNGKTPLLGKESDYTKMGMGTANLFLVYFVMHNIFMMFGVIGACVALFVYKPEKTLAKVSSVAEGSFGPMYIGIYLLQLCITSINANLGTARRLTSVNVPDQHVYKVVTGSDAGSIVLMDDEDDYGKFNRAQRSLQNFYEAFGMVILNYIFAGYVFPYTATVCLATFGLLRLKSALDYTRDRMERMKAGMAANLAGGSLGGIVVTIGIYATYLELM